ncbi:hypothetical protein ACFX13_013947 [Malus domestica]
MSFKYRLCVRICNPKHLCPLNTGFVFKVKGTGFKACVKPTANDQPPLTSGSDRIELKTPGNKWYICAADNHCDLGQKLVITVMDTAPASPPSSAVCGIIFSGYQVFAAAVVGVFLAIAAWCTYRSTHTICINTPKDKNMYNICVVLINLILCNID